ncbi:unnamed protein product [Rotaria sordida]|uniref:Uncharacterized protein n=1 Tax=Rotaria sordida TaxID=392033 RepID=A0A815ETT9_9BILA|nr:unnamed protein product [Rotaria sordida]CAF1316055.1 unnamed protein product [Rotaria sordida]CAF3892961.1 unnamed protein product [Rotaria sordida]CAF3909201.1 unnamed protein product [Rotaria sordida]
MEENLVPITPIFDCTTNEVLQVTTGILYQMNIEPRESNTHVKYVIDKNFNLLTSTATRDDYNQLWCLIPVTVTTDNSTDVTHVGYRIKNAQTGKVITCDGMCCLLNGALMSLQSDDPLGYTNPKRLWTLTSVTTSKEKFVLCNQYTQHRLSLGPIIGSRLLSPYIRCSKATGDFISFSMPSVTFNGEILKMEFDQPLPQLLTKSTENILISSHIIRNQTLNSTHTESITHSITRTNSFTYSFKESLKYLSGLSFKAEIPFISTNSGSTIDMKSELGGESQQQWTQTRQETYSISKTITVPPNECIEVKSFVQWIENISIPFKAKIKVSGRCHRLRSDDGQIIENQPMNRDLIEQYLKMNSFQGQILSYAEDNVLMAELAGVFTGSYGLGTDTELKNI